MKAKGYKLVDGIWFKSEGIPLGPREIIAIVKRVQRMNDDVALGNRRKFSFLLKKKGPK